MHFVYLEANDKMIARTPSANINRGTSYLKEVLDDEISCRPLCSPLLFNVGHILNHGSPIEDGIIPILFDTV